MQGSHQAPQQDLDLGVQTFVNGTPMSPVQINTTQAAAALPKPCDEVPPLHLVLRASPGEPIAIRVAWEPGHSGSMPALHLPHEVAAVV